MLNLFCPHITDTSSTWYGVMVVWTMGPKINSITVRHHFETPCQILEQTVLWLPRKTQTNTDMGKYNIGFVFDAIV